MVNFVDNCLNWNDPIISSLSLLVQYIKISYSNYLEKINLNFKMFIIFVLKFEFYMIPLPILFIFLINYINLIAKKESELILNSKNNQVC